MAVTQSAAGTAVSTRAPVLEVFASVQGEGRYVGQPQTFVRLRGCPLRCRWCDTPGSWTVEPGAQARLGTGRRARRVASWAGPLEVAAWVAEVEDGPARPLSLTGGEPLAWPGFVGALRRGLGGRRVHLETAGAHPEALAQVLDAVDHVSLDLKLPDDLEPPVELPRELTAEPGGGAGLARERAPSSASEWARVRRRVLGLVRGRDACAKIPVAGDRRLADFLPLLDELHQHAPELECVLQPITPTNGVPAPSWELLEALIRAGLERGLDLRLLPQVHRQLRIP